MRPILFVLLITAAARAGDADRALLEANGVAPDAGALGAYLRSLCPSDEERAIADEAIRNLGSEDPVTRHEALLRLGALRAPPLGAIRDAASGSDADVRRVATRLLDDALRRTRKDLLAAALRRIADEAPKGLADEVLAVAPLAAEVRLSPAVDAALRATLEDRDLSMLRSAARESDAATRCAALRALGTAPGAEPDEATPWLDEKDPRIRLAAALALADRGDRRCTDPFLALLGAESPAVRRDAASALRATVGGGEAFNPFAAEEERRGAIRAWREWVANRPADAGWPHPLPIGPRQLGRTLISLYPEGRVIELDSEGRKTFEASGLEGPWAIEGLPNGHRLVALHGAQAIVEYDAEGMEVARTRVPGRPWGFHRLGNGNTLIAVSETDSIIELRPDGSVAEEITVRSRPVDVRLLDNGNLLVCARRPSRVSEVDREGHVRWSLAGIASPRTARRLDNGNTLVAEVNGRAAEFDPLGNLVWERTELVQCHSAERLPEGGTLVATPLGVCEIAPDGTERWLLRSEAFARATRY